MARDTTLLVLGGESVARNWVDSVVALLAFDLMRDDGRLSRPMSVSFSAGGLEDAANLAVAAFLDGPDDWLFWTDLDMGFRPDVLDRLLAAADAAERPVVSALTFQWRQVARDGLGGFLCVPRPSILEWVEVDGVRTFKCRDDYPPDTLVRCAATGMACVVIHRRVFEAIRDRYGPCWFDRLPPPPGGTDRLGPDVSFCVRAGACEIPVHVDTGVPTGHQKAAWIGPEVFHLMSQADV